MSFSFPSHAKTGVVISGHNAFDDDGNPAGGYAQDSYFGSDDDDDGGRKVHHRFLINWQDGPVKRIMKTVDAGTDRESITLAAENMEDVNGAFVEDVLQVVAERLQFYQSSDFACSENAESLRHVELAISVLNARNDDRLRRGVLGKHEK